MNSAKLNILSIFFSISGEVNIWPQGAPTIFIRFAGCNLNCHYCDTKQSINAAGTQVTVEEIIEQIKSFDCKRVLITGGEPLLQKNGLQALIRELDIHGYMTSVETNGSLPLDILPEHPDCWVVDIKMPGSGYFGSMILPEKHLQDAEERDNLIFKFPVEDEQDYEAAINIIKNLDETSCGLALSPVSPLTAAELWEWMVRDCATHCILNTQIHKTIWPNSKIER